MKLVENKESALLSYCFETSFHCVNTYLYINMHVVSITVEQE